MLGVNFVWGSDDPRLVAWGAHCMLPVVWMHIRQEAPLTTMELEGVIREVMKNCKGRVSPTSYED